MKQPRKQTIKKSCLYTEWKNRLNKLLVSRSVNKDNSKDDEINEIRAKIDYFEWGIKQFVTILNNPHPLQKQ